MSAPLIISLYCSSKHAVKFLCRLGLFRRPTLFVHGHMFCVDANRPLSCARASTRCRFSATKVFLASGVGFPVFRVLAKRRDSLSSTVSRRRHVSAQQAVMRDLLTPRAAATYSSNHPAYRLVTSEAKRFAIIYERCMADRRSRKCRVVEGCLGDVDPEEGSEVGVFFECECRISCDNKHESLMFGFNVFIRRIKYMILLAKKLTTSVHHCPTRRDFKLCFC